MKETERYVAAEPGEVYWRREVCPHRGAKVLLKTVGGVCVQGQWYGALNQHFTAWSPMPKDGDPPEREPMDYHSIQLKVKRLDPQAVVPVYKTDGAACFDICALKGGVVREGMPLVVDTGLAFEVPEGWVLQVFSRSGHGFKQGVRLVNGTGIIDSDYRGELKIGLTRDLPGAFVVNYGDAIAQGMLVRAPVVQMMEVETLSETVRGEGGFGSTDRLPTNPNAIDRPMSARRQAYENHFHKIPATISYPEWCALWAKGEAPGQAERATQTESLREGSTTRVPGVGEL